MNHRPGEIERESMRLIEEELSRRGVSLRMPEALVIRRCIHASADFDYADTLKFTPDAVRLGAETLRRGAVIVTDTNMALSGVNRTALSALGGSACCYMADEAVAACARERGCTRAEAAMERAAREHPEAVLAVGNAPTALLRTAELMEEGLFRPSLVIAVPVGFVNVTESKERIFRLCEEKKVPAIAAMGRKGGSSIAAAICNALLYLAADMTDPAERGWG